MKKRSLLLILLSLLISCSRQDFDIQEPKENPPFQMRIEVFDHNYPPNPIENATIKIWITEDDTVFTGKTDSNGIIYPPQFSPQYILTTVEAAGYYSSYNDRRDYKTYADSVFIIQLVEYLSPTDTIFTPDNFDFSEIAWAENDFYLTTDKILCKYESGFTNYYPDESWMLFSADTMSYQGLMWNSHHQSIWSNFAKPISNSPTGSYINIHRGGTPWVIVERHPFYFEFDYDWGKDFRSPSDLTWYDSTSFYASVYTNKWGMEVSYLVRTEVKEISEDFIELGDQQLFNASRFNFITGIAYDGNYLWGCNQNESNNTDIFAFSLDEWGNIEEFLIWYKVQNLDFSSMTTDKKGKFWFVDNIHIAGENNRIFTFNLPD